jgi:hypothetical protein
MELAFVGLDGLPYRATGRRDKSGSSLFGKTPLDATFKRMDSMKHALFISMLSLQ